MQLIGVIDILRGRAVRAHRGRRHQYRPVDRVADTPINGGPVALARVYVDRYRLDTLYAADLDAITTGEMNAATLRQIADIAPLWVDAGITSHEIARDVIDLGATHAVVGLETLPSFAALSAIGEAIGHERIAFSLDLRNGEPMLAPGVVCHGSPADIAARASDAGARAIIVIDLARVGTGAGLDFELLSRIRAAVPTARLLAGGGIRGVADIGYDGALVASALHDGALMSTR